MMILPIKLISETDQPIFGGNLYNLAKLERFNLPVGKGLAISPPEIILNTILEHLQDSRTEVIEQRLEVIKKEIFKTPLPASLNQELEDLLGKKGKNLGFLVAGNFLEKKELVWVKLLEIWLTQILSFIWRMGFSRDINSHITAQAVFITNQKFDNVTAFFDPELEDVVIKVDKKLEPADSKKIDEVVLAANKKLFLPQVYQFVKTDNKVYLMGLTPFTQSLPVSPQENIILPKAEQKKIVKSAVKVFLNLSQGFVVGENIDGILIEGENVKGWGNPLDWFDNTAFKLAEASLSYHHKPIIFKLPDVLDKEVRGICRLLNQQSLLKQATDVFLFVRNKKNLLNLELALPLVRNSGEFLEIKKELASRGLSRKGTLKFWLEVGVPENLINLQDYLEIGLDGIILNLDELQKNLGGYSLHEGEFYGKQVVALIKFLTPTLKILHNEKIPVLVKGELANHHDVLDFLIEAGIWGVVANTPLEADNLPEQLSWSERRMVLKRFS